MEPPFNKLDGSLKKKKKLKRNNIFFTVFILFVFTVRNISIYQ